MKDAGHSNVTIAALLGVDEASVRRGLKGYVPPAAAPARFVIEIREA